MNLESAKFRAWNRDGGKYKNKLRVEGIKLGSQISVVQVGSD